ASPTKPVEKTQEGPGAAANRPPRPPLAHTPHPAGLQHLDVDKALKELRETTMADIERTTAITWGGRAAASFRLAQEATDATPVQRLLQSGLRSPLAAMEYLATACAPLDLLLDGGLERDAITLVFGEGGSGKTNLALQCAREAAARGLRTAYVDTEGVSS